MCLCPIISWIGINISVWSLLEIQYWKEILKKMISQRSNVKSNVINNFYKQRASSLRYECCVKQFSCE